VSLQAIALCAPVPEAASEARRNPINARVRLLVCCTSKYLLGVRALSTLSS
jgi:hypothetical protein